MFEKLSLEEVCSLVCVCVCMESLGACVPRDGVDCEHKIWVSHIKKEKGN